MQIPANQCKSVQIPHCLSAGQEKLLHVPSAPSQSLLPRAGPPGPPSRARTSSTGLAWLWTDRMWVTPFCSRFSWSSESGKGSQVGITCPPGTHRPPTPITPSPPDPHSSPSRCLSSHTVQGRRLDTSFQAKSPSDALGTQQVPEAIPKIRNDPDNSEKAVVSSLLRRFPDMP